MRVSKHAALELVKRRFMKTARSRPTLVAVVLVLMLAACSSDPRQQVNEAADGQTEISGRTERADRPTPVPTRERPTPAPPQTESWSGRGDSVIRLSQSDVDLVAIVEISHRGSSNFVVQVLDGSGSNIDLLVNTIGSYTGTRLIDEIGTDAALIEITADGAWDITVSSVALANVGQITNWGTGDEVLLFRDSDSVSVKIGEFTCNGCESNVVMLSYSDSGRDLLINDIGAYSGQVVVPAGTFLITIEADSQWAFTLS